MWEARLKLARIELDSCRGPVFRPRYERRPEGPETNIALSHAANRGAH